MVAKPYATDESYLVPNYRSQSVNHKDDWQVHRKEKCYRKLSYREGEPQGGSRRSFRQRIGRGGSMEEAGEMRKPRLWEQKVFEGEKPASAVCTATLSDMGLFPLHPTRLNFSRNSKKRRWHLLETCQSVKWDGHS